MWAVGAVSESDKVCHSLKWSLSGHFLHWNSEAVLEVGSMGGTCGLFVLLQKVTSFVTL